MIFYFVSISQFFCFFLEPIYAQKLKFYLSFTFMLQTLVFCLVLLEDPNSV